MSNNTYWNNKGQYQDAVNRLHDLTPASGPVDRPYKNKALERFRKAANAYYRLYNDGDFRPGTGKMFGIERLSQFSYYKWYKDRNGRHVSRKDWTPELYVAVEQGLQPIIIAACEEQGIELK